VSEWGSVWLAAAVVEVVLTVGAVVAAVFGDGVSSVLPAWFLISTWSGGLAGSLAQDEDTFASVLVGCAGGACGWPAVELVVLAAYLSDRLGRWRL
jgi:hypothetical protein